jgi:hypothetical protein
LDEDEVLAAGNVTPRIIAVSGHGQRGCGDNTDLQERI